MATKIANPILGAAWQASAPVWAMAIAIPLGWERATRSRLVGIALALAGAAFIVLWGALDELGGGMDEIVGNILFFFNVRALTLVPPPPRPSGHPWAQRPASDPRSLIARLAHQSPLPYLVLA